MVLVRQIPVPTEGIKLQGPGVEAFVDNEGHGKGNLFVTEANIAWINSDSGEGFKLAYKKMTLHAISRDPGVHSRACLYIMVNGNVLDEDEDFQVETPADVDGEDVEEEMTEIRFVPEEDSALDEMYKAVQECSLLHPDPSSDLSNEEEDPDEMFEGYAPGAGGDGNGTVQEGDEELGEDEEDDEETQRLEEFLRMQLHFRNRRNEEGDDQNNGSSNNGNGNGGSRLSFVPQPGQFDDP